MDTNSLVYEMKVLNELRKLKPEQRKELVETLEREEQLEEEALKKNPNLHIETKLQQVLTELNDVRNELRELKRYKHNSMSTLDTPMCINRVKCHIGTLDNDDNESETELTFDWWPIIIFVFIFLTIISLPSGSSKIFRPCPITL